jgi:hypothetical protein
MAGGESVQSTVTSSTNCEVLPGGARSGGQTWLDFQRGGLARL